MFKSKRARLGLIGAVIVIILVAARLLAPTQTQAVEIGQVQVRPVRTTVLASGSVAFVRTVELRPEITGRVSRIAVSMGDFVKQGDILLEFDPSTLQAELSRQTASIAAQQGMLRRANDSLDRADRHAQRSREIFERQLMSRDGYDDIQTTANLARHDLQIQRDNLKMATAMRRSIEENLGKTVIRAPFDGQVVDVAIKIGETAVAGITNMAGSQLMTLADTQDVVADLLVDEVDVGRLAIGQPVEVDVVALGERRMTGKVAEIGLAAQPKQGNEALKYKARVAFPAMDTAGVLKDMTVRAEVVVAAGQAAPAVPLRAILSEPLGRGERRHHLFVVEGNRARKRVVELGRADDEFQVVSAGVSAGDRFVVGPYEQLRHLKDGDIVRSVQTQ